MYQEIMMYYLIYLIISHYIAVFTVLSGMFFRIRCSNCFNCCYYYYYYYDYYYYYYYCCCYYYLLLLCFILIFYYYVLLLSFIIIIKLIHIYLLHPLPLYNLLLQYQYLPVGQKL